LRAKASGTKKERESETPRKKRLSFFALKSPDLRPSSDYDDDPRTHEYNLKALQREEEKQNPNKEVVMDLMKKTFFIRRQNILKLKAPISVANLLKIYPSLRNYNQVSTYAGTIINIMNLLICVVL